MSEDQHADPKDQQIRLLERRVLQLQAQLRMCHWGAGAAALLVVLIGGVLLFGRTPPVARAIVIDGKPVVLVRSEKEAAVVRQRLLATAGEGRATFRETWQDATRPTNGQRILSVSEAVRVLKDKVTVLKEAFAIEAGGNLLVVVPTQEMAQTVLDRAKAKYASPTDAVVRMTQLRPQPTVRPCTELPSRIVTEEDKAVAELAHSRRRMNYFIKAGDYPEQIAGKFGMTLDEFWEANPGLQGTTLHPGQRVQVLCKQPGLAVVTVKETVITETIPAGVQKQNSPTLPRGQTQITSPGKPGQRRVRWEITTTNDREVARRPLGEEIVSEPQPQLILVGTM